MPYSMYLLSETKPFKLVVQRITFLLLLIVPAWVAANESQLHILNAGINLGWAVATLELRGDADPDDAAFVASAVATAAMHVDEARKRFRQPYREDRLVEGIDQRVIDKANNYAQRSARLSMAHRIGYIRGIWSMYRQSFQTTYLEVLSTNMERSGYHYYPNCDFSILNVGYHFGRAQVAANVAASAATTAERNEAESYQNSANGSMRAAVQAGLNVALDGYPYGPRTDVRKACCYFGSKEAWGLMPDFQHNSPVEMYERYLRDLQDQVRSTVMPPGACGGRPLDRAYEECARKHPGSVPGGTGVVGGDAVCVCPEGFTWNSGHTACEKLIPPNQLCARDYPNSIASGRASDGSVNCTCPNGYTWNSNRTACEKLLPPDQLCARDYPGSIANGRAHDGSVNCECPSGYTWNSTRTACEQLLPPDQLCARDYPGSIARGRASDGSVHCECPQGSEWNAGNTRCIEVAANSAECNRIIGHWRWFTERDVEFMANNRWKTADGITGSWKCNRDGSVLVVPDDGSFKDTVRVSGDGSSLSGSSEQGVTVTAVRKQGGRSQDCPPGYNPYGCL